MIRSVRSTDLVALLAFGARALPNEAKTRERLGKKVGMPGSVEKLIEQWLPGGHHHTWLAVEEGRILGLVSARDRGGHSAWEVESLLLDADGDEARLTAALLDALVGSAEEGVERVFLRLEAGNSLLSAVVGAGFTPYLDECLYQRSRDSAAPLKRETVPNPYVLRRRTSSDDLALFELYRAAVPTSVRRVEALTLKEWQDSRERAGGRRGRRGFVLEREGRLVGWLQLVSSRGLGHFDLMAHPQDELAQHLLLHQAMVHLQGRATLFCLAPAYQEALCHCLEGEGFKEVARYTSLVKQTTVRLKEPRLVPVVA